MEKDREGSVGLDFACNEELRTGLETEREREQSQFCTATSIQTYFSHRQSPRERGGSKIGPNVPMEYPTLDAAVHESLGREMMMNRRHKVWP